MYVRFAEEIALKCTHDFRVVNVSILRDTDVLPVNDFINTRDAKHGFLSKAKNITENNTRKYAKSVQILKNLNIEKV